MALGTSFDFSYSDGVNERSSVSISGVKITGLFQDGDGITEVTLNGLGRALEGVASTMSGYTTELIQIVSQGEASIITVTP